MKSTEAVWWLTEVYCLDREACLFVGLLCCATPPASWLVSGVFRQLKNEEEEEEEVEEEEEQDEEEEPRLTAETRSG